MTRRTIGRATRRAVRLRAGERCEYCRLPRSAVVIPFHVDHVLSRQHGGSTTLGNLTCCCADCDRHKGPNLGSINPATGRFGRLFIPRTDRWEAHFQWVGSRMVGRTARGELTIGIPDMNAPGLLSFRQVLMEQRLF